jgi:hypothetical protein
MEQISQGAPSMSVIYEEQGIAADGNVAAKCNYGNLPTNGDGSADLCAPCHQLAYDWVKRVLGIEITVIATVSGAQGLTGPRPKLTPIWIDAKEEVDAGISRLQAALRETGDDDLEQIAEFGLFGASDGENVALMVALREADTGAEGGLDKVESAVADYKDFLDGAPIIDLIENNPFGVTVPLRKTLGGALQQLERLTKAA